MGVSKCPFCCLEEKGVSLNFYITKERGTDKIISVKEFEDLIPEKIFNKMNNENSYLNNSKNSVYDKTIKIAEDEIGNNKIYYHGEFNEYNEKDGIGKMIIINENNEKTYYHGIWKKDKLIKGTIYYKNEAEYKGEINNNLKEGFGEYISDIEEYKGNWKEDKKCGFGIITYKDGSKYKGDFKNDKFNGDGEMLWSDGTKYKGGFYEGSFYGKGYLEGKNNRIYDGYFLNGLFNGKGLFKWMDGHNIEVYNGDYCNGKKDGKGKILFKNGDSYDGNWESGLPHGEGVYETKNRKYRGNWRSGEFMQLIEVEEKEGAEEEFFNLSFKTPNEDIYIPNHIVTSLNSNASGKSVYIDASVEYVK